MEMLSNVVTLVLLGMVFLASLMKKEEIVEEVQEVVETNVKYLSDLTYEEIMNLLGRDYIENLYRADVVDIEEYKNNLRNKIRKQLDEEVDNLFIPDIDKTSEEFDDGLFSLNPRMHDRREDLHRKSRENRNRMLDLEFFNNYKVSY